MTNTSEKDPRLKEAENKIASYICKLCGKRFSSVSSLEEHEATHAHELSQSDVEDESDELSQSIGEGESDELSQSDGEDESDELSQSDVEGESDELSQSDGEGESMEIHQRRSFAVKHKVKKNKKDLRCDHSDSGPTEPYTGKNAEHEKPDNSHVEKFKDKRKSKVLETIVCSFCGKRINSRQGYNNHMRVHKFRSSAKFTCPTCGLALGCLRTYQRHIEVHKKSFTCEECGKQFQYLSHLRGHYLTHNGLLPYRCEAFACDRRFGSIQGLRYHIAKLLKCSECDQQFHKVLDFDRHKTKHDLHLEKDIRGRELRSTDRRLQANSARVHSTKNIICKVCGKRFANQNGMQIHLRTHFSEISTLRSSGKYRTPGNMNQDKELKSYQCNICLRRCRSRDRLTEHVGIHSNDRGLECTSCGMRLKSHHSLSNHKKTHMKKDNHVCKICGNTFKFKHMLKRHSCANPH